MKIFSMNDMSCWYYEEYSKYKNQLNEDIDKLSKYSKIRFELFSRVVEKVNEYKDELSFSEKKEQYILKIKELGRNLKQSDGICFSGTTKDMYSWYMA